MSVTANRAAASPLVTVVIPTYNREKLVLEAVGSVLQDASVPVEILVVDDGSTDGTVATLGRLAGAVRVICLPHEGRVGRVRNAGIRQARGGFVAFLDSDDLWLPGKLRAQVELLAAHPEYVAAYTNEGRYQAGRLLERTRFDQYPPMTRPLYRQANRCVHTSTVLVRREVLDGVGPFNESLLVMEDADLWSRISEEGEFGVVKEPLAIYRPDVDGLHAARVPARVRLRETQKYFRLYEERRRGKPMTDDEAREANRFRAAVREMEQRLEQGVMDPEAIVDGTWFDRLMTTVTD